MGRRLMYEDDLVVERKGDEIVYKGIFDYWPDRDSFDGGEWSFDGDKYTCGAGWAYGKDYTMEVVAKREAFYDWALVDAFVERCIDIYDNQHKTWSSLADIRFDEDVENAAENQFHLNKESFDEGVRRVFEELMLWVSERWESRNCKRVAARRPFGHIDDALDWCDWQGKKGDKGMKRKADTYDSRTFLEVGDKFYDKTTDLFMVVVEETSEGFWCKLADFDNGNERFYTYEQMDEALYLQSIYWDDLQLWKYKCVGRRSKCANLSDYDWFQEGGKWLAADDRDFVYVVCYDGDSYLAEAMDENGSLVYSERFYSVESAMDGCVDFSENFE